VTFDFLRHTNTVINNLLTYLLIAETPQRRRVIVVTGEEMFSADGRTCPIS